jgi:hypothetical protein
MNSALRPFAGLLLLCVACERAVPPPAPEPLADPVARGIPLRFSGELVLTGAVARATEGAIVVALRRIGGTRALWQRSYELTDPWWMQTPASRVLPFGLSEADAIVDPAPSLSVEMEIVARYDADGNPATIEPDAVEAVSRALTGATDVILTVGRPRTDLSPGPGLSQITGEKPPAVRQGEQR